MHSLRQKRIYINLSALKPIADLVRRKSDHCVNRGRIILSMLANRQSPLHLDAASINVLGRELIFVGYN